MTDDNQYWLWIQRDVDKSLKDDSTQCYSVMLNQHQMLGIYHALLALSCDIRAWLTSYGPYLLGYEDGYNTYTITDQYICVRDIQELNKKTYYNYCCGHIAKRPRHQNMMFVLFRDPFRQNTDTYFIIPCNTISELQGIFSIYLWLGYNPQDYLVSIQDSNGNSYRVE